MSRHMEEWRVPSVLVAGAAVAAVLYWAQDVFVLIAFGVLLSFLLGPLVERLERIHIHRTIAALIACGLAVGMLALLAWVVATQGMDLVQKLPDYKENLERKIDSLRGKVHNVVASASKTFNALEQKTTENHDGAAQTRTDGASETPPAPGDPQQQPAPLPPPTRVTVIEKDRPLTVVGTLFSTLASPLGKLAVVLFLTFFMLVERAQILDRVIRLAGRSRLNLTTQALGDVGERVSRYLAMQLIVNAVYGLCVCGGLALIGIPNAMLFGLLAMVLRFMPYIGFWIAAVLPLVLSLAAPSWHEPLLTIALFATLEIVANYVEPLLYGVSTGLSPIAVVVAALFWTFIWGPAGLLLSTPMTVVLVVLGKYIPSMEFLAVALSDEPALEAHWQLYHRLLTAEFEDAEELFSSVQHDHSLIETYDQVLLRALVLAETDYHHGRIDGVRRKIVHSSIREFAELHRSEPTPAGLGLKAPVSVLCVPARDEADEIAGTMLAQVLIERGVSAQATKVNTLASELLDTIERDEIGVICISAVPPAGMRHARYLYKRIRARFPDVFIVIGTWTRIGHGGRMPRVTATMDATRDAVVSTEADAAECVLRMVERCALQRQAVR